MRRQVDDVEKRLVFLSFCHPDRMNVKVRALSLPPARFKTMSDSVSNTLEAQARPRELMVELQERQTRGERHHRSRCTSDCLRANGPDA